MRWVKRDQFVMDDGTMILANCGIIGLGPELTVHEGYDGDIHEVDLHENLEGLDWIDEATPETKKELADFMISRWTQYKERAK